MCQADCNIIGEVERQTSLLCTYLNQIYPRKEIDTISLKLVIICVHVLTSDYSS